MGQLPEQGFTRYHQGDEQLVKQVLRSWWYGKKLLDNQFLKRWMKMSASTTPGRSVIDGIEPEKR